MTTRIVSPSRAPGQRPGASRFGEDIRILIEAAVRDLKAAGEEIKRVAGQTPAA